MLALILNIALIIVQVLILYLGLEIAVRFDRWLVAKTNKKFYSLIPFWFVLFSIILPVSGFLSFKVAPDIFFNLGKTISPDYFVGPQLYTLWYGPAWIIVLILVYFLFRISPWSVIGKGTRPEEVGLPKKWVAITLIIIGFLAISYISYIVYYSYKQGAIEQIIEGVTGGERITNNIYRNKEEGYTITLYPRNGTWGVQEEYEFFSLPDSQNSYELTVNLFDKSVFSQEKDNYIQDDGLVFLSNLSSNGVSWEIYEDKKHNYRTILNAPDDIRALVAKGEYKEKIILLIFSHRNDSDGVVVEKAESDFVKMVKSFNFN